MSTATIPKGTVITGTFPEGRKVAGRTYTVKVHGIDNGYEGYCFCRTGADHGWTDEPEAPWPAPLDDGHGKHCVRPRPAEVTWVGTGGYWHNARLADVLIDAAADI
jgi:hypothetical protein